MSTPPNIKRRRLNPPSDALRKPFKSPLKQSGTQPSTSPDSYFNGYRDDVIISTHEEATGNHSPTHLAATAPTHHTTFSKPLIPLPRSPPNPLPLDNTTKNEIAALSRRARQLRSEIDTLEQATRLVTPKPQPSSAHLSTSSHPANYVLEDDQLRALVKKWRTISQSAADSLFGLTNDRINRMGGVAAWREKEREKVRKLEEWRREDAEAEAAALRNASESDDDDDEEEEDSGGERHGEFAGMSRTEKEEMKAMKKAARKEARDAAKEMAEGLKGEGDTACLAVEERVKGAQAGQNSDQAALVDDDSFTVGMMLKTMGIDFEVVGWDAETGRWAEQSAAA